MKSNNILRDEDGYVQMHRIHKFPPKSEDGAYLIDSRKSKNKQKNYLSNAEKVERFDDNLLFSELIPEKEVTKPKKCKNKKKKKANRFTGIQKAPQKIRKMPFHPDKNINKIIQEKFDNLKIKKMSNDIDFIDMLLHCYKGYICFNVKEGQFYWYTGKFWKIDDEYQVYNFIAKLCYEIHHLLRKNDADKSALKQSILYGTSLNNRIQCIEDDLSDIDKQISNIVNVVARTGSTALTDKLKELEQEKAEKSYLLSSLQEQLHSVKIDNESLKKAFQKAKNLLKNGNLATQKLIVNTYVNCVKLYPDRIEIIFNLMPSYTVQDMLEKVSM